MFGIRLKELRKQYGITQEQLAKIVGVERSSIGKYEGKSAVIPSDDVRVKIADYFHVTVDYLMGWTDEPYPILSDDLTADELKFLQDYRSLNTQGQEYMRQTMHMALPIYIRHPDTPDVEIKEDLAIG